LPVDEYFSPVYAKENVNNIPSPLNITTAKNVAELAVVELTEERICNVLANLKPNKIGGVDGFYSSYLTGIAEAIAFPLLPKVATDW